MNKSRVRKLKELINKGDPRILLTIRKFYGDKTEKMDQTSIYRAAKKLWSQHKLVI